jgi:hypothetical protein
MNELENTKSCSISNMNITNNLSIVEHVETTTEKVIPLDEKPLHNKENMAHTRSLSLQQSVIREPFTPKEESFQDTSELLTQLQDIQNLKAENEELTKIYDQ